MLKGATNLESIKNLQEYSEIENRFLDCNCSILWNFEIEKSE